MTGLRPYWVPERWTQLRLPRLFDDDDADGVGQWSFAMVTIERSGRVTLPAAARTAFRGCVSVRVSSRGEVAVLRGGGGGGGGGRLVTVDERGRLVVPCWLREAADPDRVLLVGTGTAGDGAPVVLLAPPRLLLGGFAHAMVGER